MSSRSEACVIYLCPLVWRALQANFAPRFERLSATCTGAIFTMSGARERGTAIGRFRFYAEPESTSPLRYLRRLWVQIVMPVVVLRGKARGRRVVVAYDPYLSGFAGVLLKAVLGAKLIVEINGDDRNQRVEENGIGKRRIMGAVFQLVLRMADAVKVVNTDQEKFVRRHFPGKPVYRFPDFVASDYFSSLETTNGDYLLSIGHPFHLKGMDVLIRAFHEVAASHPNLKLRIMGYATASELSQYRVLAREDPRIEFVKPGWAEDVAEQMRNCLAYVSASRREAGARVLFEAMACAKPVISSRTNSGNDYVRDARTGYLFNVGDWRDLAAKLEQLLVNEERARVMGEEGRRWVAREFSEPVYIDKFCGMLRDVLP